MRRGFLLTVVSAVATICIPAVGAIAEPSGSSDPAPHITDCQVGLGPVVTYWSDGSVTGWSPECQAVHDKVLQDEADANRPQGESAQQRNLRVRDILISLGCNTSGCIQTYFACEDGLIDLQDRACDFYRAHPIV
ncbi:hypothetical protein ACQPW1_13555 [Nocardia sp. CA-128927]|uniref:hypothetical protein n=1 Tax=Nocardia sp. CA-128927 TaxID=3239975 RepID=UPI003D952F94